MEIDTPLRRLRRTRALTLETVAAAVGTDTGNLSRIERGKQTSLALAAALVDYFGVGDITEAEILYPERFPQPAVDAAEAPKAAA